MLDTVKLEIKLISLWRRWIPSGLPEPSTASCPAIALPAGAAHPLGSSPPVQLARNRAETIPHRNPDGEKRWARTDGQTTPTTNSKGWRCGVIMQADSSKPCREQGIGRGFLWGSVGTSSLVSPKAPRRFTDTGGQRFYSERQPPPPQRQSPAPPWSAAACFAVRRCCVLWHLVVYEVSGGGPDDKDVGRVRGRGSRDAENGRATGGVIDEALGVEDTGGGSPLPFSSIPL